MGGSTFGGSIKENKEYQINDHISLINNIISEALFLVWAGLHLYENCIFYNNTKNTISYRSTGFSIKFISCYHDDFYGFQYSESGRCSALFDIEYNYLECHKFNIGNVKDTIVSVKHKGNAINIGSSMFWIFLIK